MMNKRFPSYLCPICMVKFPYSEKLTQHWTTFHGCYKHERLRSSPSVSYAASQIRYNNEEKKKVTSVGRRKLFQINIFHNYRTCTVNEHVPKACQFCGNIIWNCAKLCKECGYVCHVECQNLVISQCKSLNMQRETQSVGEYTRDYATIGDIRGCQSLSSPSMSPTSPRTMSPGSDASELDLTYITDRLIAMSFPASGLESVYHTSLLKVLKMLQTKHVEKYKIINVSERRYDILQLNEPGQVLDYGWPDHLAPPIERLHKIIGSIHSWLLTDIKNVVVIHCKGGRSRIGVVIASYIQYSKNSPSPQGALDWFALRRYYDSKLEGAIQPSQKRYVHYFGNLCEKKLAITDNSLYFQNIIMHGIPYFGNGTGLQFCLKIYEGYHLKHTTKTYCVTPSAERAYVSIEDGVQLHGDVMIKCLQKGGSSQNVIFRLQFHTDAIEGCVAVLGKYDLDEAFKDPRFPDSCYIEFIFSPTNERQRLQQQGNGKPYMEGDIVVNKLTLDWFLYSSAQILFTPISTFISINFKPEYNS